MARLVYIFFQVKKIEVSPPSRLAATNSPSDCWIEWFESRTCEKKNAGEAGASSAFLSDGNTLDVRINLVRFYGLFKSFLFYPTDEKFAMCKIGTFLFPSDHLLNQLCSIPNRALLVNNFRFELLQVLLQLLPSDSLSRGEVFDRIRNSM